MRATGEQTFKLSHFKVFIFRKALRFLIQKKHKQGTKLGEIYYRALDKFVSEQKLSTIKKVRSVIEKYYTDNLLDWFGISDIKLQPKQLGKILKEFCESVNRHTNDPDIA